MAITVQHSDHPIWGPCVFLEAEGEPEEIRDEYARDAPGWPLLHFAIARPDGLEPWYRLGFAQMHAYGKRESGAERLELPEVTIRPGGPSDLETAIRIDLVIHEAQATTPSFSSFELDERRTARLGGNARRRGRRVFRRRTRRQSVGHTTIYSDLTTTRRSISHRRRCSRTLRAAASASS
jgi:hypothetical protein